MTCNPKDKLLRTIRTMLGIDNSVVSILDVEVKPKTSKCIITRKAFPSVKIRVKHIGSSWPV